MPHLRGKSHCWRAVWVIGGKAHYGIKETTLTATKIMAIQNLFRSVPQNICTDQFEQEAKTEKH